MNIKKILFAFVSIIVVIGCQTKEDIQISPEHETAKINYYSAAFEDYCSQPNTKAESFDVDSEGWGIFAIYEGTTSAHLYGQEAWLQPSPTASWNRLVPYIDPIRTWVTPSDASAIPDNVATTYVESEMNDNMELYVKSDETFEYDPETKLYSIGMKGLGNIVAATNGIDDHTFHFKNVQGKLRMSLRSTVDSMVIRSISVIGNNKEILDGRFKVSFNYNTQPIVSLYDDEQYFYAVGPQPNELLSTETVKDFDIDIREITFTKGITAKFETNYGTIVKTTHSPLVIERSKIQPMAELVLAPQMEGTIISYESIDGNIVEPKVLKAWDKDGTLLEYINSIVPSSGFGRIVFNGFVETAEISFEDATNLLRISDISNVIYLTTCKSMFKNCVNLLSDNCFSGTFTGFNVENVTDASSMFEGCTSLSSIQGFTCRKVVNASRMFAGCTSLTGHANGLIVGDKVDMSEMFSGCTSLFTFIDGWFWSDDSSIYSSGNKWDCSDMFKGCKNLYRFIVGNLLGEKAFINDGTFADLPHNGCFAYTDTPGNLEQYNNWFYDDPNYLGRKNWSRYGYNSYQFDSFPELKKDIFDGVLWVTDVSQQGYRLSGRSVETVKTMIFSSEDFILNPDECKAMVETSGTVLSEAEVAQINTEEGYAVEFDDENNSYVLVVYYEGPKVFAYFRKETYVIGYLPKTGTLEDLGIVNPGTDYWK